MGDIDYLRRLISVGACALVTLGGEFFRLSHISNTLCDYCGTSKKVSFINLMYADINILVCDEDIEKALDRIECIINPRIKNTTE